MGNFRVSKVNTVGIIITNIPVNVRSVEVVSLVIGAGNVHVTGQHTTSVFKRGYFDPFKAIPPINLTAIMHGFNTIRAQHIFNCLNKQGPNIAARNHHIVMLDVDVVQAVIHVIRVSTD